jgi:hypothetical protein
MTEIEIFAVDALKNWYKLFCFISSWKEKYPALHRNCPALKKSVRYRHFRCWKTQKVCDDLKIVCLVFKTIRYHTKIPVKNPLKRCKKRKLKVRIDFAFSDSIWKQELDLAFSESFMKCFEGKKFFGLISPLLVNLKCK